MTEGDPRAYARSLAAESLAAGDPTGWFERLYAAARAGRTVVPWADHSPNPMLAGWPGLAAPTAGRDRALVVGAGHGDDAQLLTELGWRATGFDVAPSAVEVARERFPHTTFSTADVLEPPAGWRAAFDLVVEIYTVQVLRGDARERAVANIAGFVAPGGSLLVIARSRSTGGDAGRMPWPLTRAEVVAFPGLSLAALEDLVDDEGVPRWRAHFTRPLGPATGATRRAR